LSAACRLIHFVCCTLSAARCIIPFLAAACCMSFGSRPGGSTARPFAVSAWRGASAPGQVAIFPGPRNQLVGSLLARTSQLHPPATIAAAVPSQTVARPMPS
jgi:hypothetical protein